MRFRPRVLDQDSNRTVTQVGISGEPLIRQEWIDLIEKFPGDFLLGSDKVGDSTNDKYEKEIRKFDSLLAQSRPEGARQVASLNWLRIVPKTG